MFKIIKQDSKARTGEFSTLHGKLETPFFMPDATRAVVKGLNRQELQIVGVSAMVINTYHLYLQGLSAIKKVGGIHNFMNWPAPLLSDSGGYQVFSLIYQSQGKMGKILPDKVIFKSPIDGSIHELTPEKSIQIQFDLKTDMMVCLDDVRPNDKDRAQTEASVERTIAWAKRCKKEFELQLQKNRYSQDKRPLLFAVVQGGVFPDLRKVCAKELVKIGFDGLGYGARPIDSQGNFLADVLQKTAEAIPENYIRFALGIGTPEHMQKCFELGWDMFDCVIPTREGRHGRLYMNDNQVININNAEYALDFSVINEKSKIIELHQYSKAYLHHLFKINDSLGQRLASLNNLEYYANLLV